MLYSVAANLLMIVHLLFVLFVILGGLLLFRWPRFAFVHLPAAAWGAIIEFNNWVCPLTPLEQSMRRAAGEQGYSGGFIEHYLLPVLYPTGLTPNLQIILGSVVVLVNLFIYGWLLWRKRHTLN
jgi:hypothetical protein